MDKKEMEEQIAELGRQVEDLLEDAREHRHAQHVVPCEPEPQPEEFITVGERRYRLMLDSPIAEVGRALREATLDGGIKRAGWYTDYISKVEKVSGNDVIVTIHLMN